MSEVTKLIRPVREKSAVTSGYGSRPDPFNPGKTQFHNGLDYVSEAGPDVLAICDGIVWFDHDHYDPRDEWQFNTPHSGGNMVIVQHIIHGQKIFAGYLHLVKNFVKVGEAVKMGQVIGVYGDVGASAGPHLHHMWKDKDNVVVDPTQRMLMGLRANGVVK